MEWGWKSDNEPLGDIHQVPATDFDLYVRENRSLLGKAKLLELSQHLSQQPGLKSPQAVKKGDMQPLHQSIFWFIIKNIIPRAQGRNQTDAMDQCLTDLMDWVEQINLPAFMINHIARIATTPRAHDLGYGFLLTRVFEHFGVELKKKVDAQVINEIGSSTIMGCGFALIQGGVRSEHQGVPAPRPPTSQPAASTSTLSQQQLQDEITALKGVLQAEQELNAKSHADLLALLSALQPKPPAPWDHPALVCFYPSAPYPICF